MTGRVYSIDGNLVSVIPENIRCSLCADSGCKKRSGLFTVENRKNLPLIPGQMVETAPSPGRTILQGFFALLPPAAGFAAGYVLSGFLTAAEGAKAAGGILLMAAGGFACYAVRRLFPPRERPHIKRVIA
jgi:positive regulator of sigma E activity